VHGLLITSTAITATTWHQASLRIIEKTSGGEIHASLDGVEFATMTNANTQPGASTVIESFKLWGCDVGTQTTAFDDLTLVTQGLAANPVSHVTKQAAFPGIPTTKIHPTRVWHPLVSTQRSAKTKIVTFPTIPHASVAGGSRVWAPVAIFGHITPRPTYGQIWPRGTMA
jgi:hypothetical protein